MLSRALMSRSAITSPGTAREASLPLLDSVLWKPTSITSTFDFHLFSSFKLFVAGLRKLCFGSCVRWFKSIFCLQLSIIPLPRAQKCSKVEGKYHERIASRVEQPVHRQQALLCSF